MTTPYTRFQADWKDGVTGGTALVSDFFDLLEATNVTVDARVTAIEGAYAADTDLTTEINRATAAEGALITMFATAVGVVVYSGGWASRPTGFGSVEWRGPVATPPYVFRTFGGATISTGTAITASGAAFTSADVGAPITGPGIPANTTIATVTDATHAALSITSTNASGLTVQIAPNGMRENDTADLI
jgi:hypothetical protein